MKRIICCLLSVVVAMAAWCTPSFATQDIAGGGALTGVNPGLAGTGVKEGAKLTGGGTLTVEDQDIYTDNKTNDGVVTDKTKSAVSSDADNTHTITFNGTSTVYGRISGVDPGEKVFLAINAGAVAKTVTFLGRVNATTLNVTGTGTVYFNSGNSNNAAITFAGGSDGKVILGTNTTVIGAMANTAGANKSTLELWGGSTLDGAVGADNALKAIYVKGGSNSLGVNAYITDQAKAYAFYLETNTLHITGALAMPNLVTGGVVNTTLASESLYGNIRVTGATNIGNTLGINVTIPTTVYIAKDTQFDIIKTETGTAQSGTDSSIVTVTAISPTNSLYKFSQVPITGTVAGLVTIKLDEVPIEAADEADDPVAPVAQIVAQALLDAPSTPDMDSIRAAINALSNAGDVVNAEAQLAPLAPALAAPLITFQGIRQFQDLWLARLDMCSEFSRPWPDKEDPSCRGNKQNSAWWVKGVGYWGLRKDSGAYKGFETRILGTMIAYDVPLGLNTRGGLGVGYGRTDIDGKTFDTSTDFDTYRAMAYIGHELGSWFINGGLSFGWNEYSGRRHISFSGVERTANAKYDGQDYTAFASTGYHVFAKKFSITPFGSLQYTRVNIGSYAETDAGDVSLKVNSQGYDFYESGLGVKAARDFVYRGGTFVPDIHFKWLHDFSNPTLEQTARFNYQGTSTFVTHGLKISDDTYNVGIGLTFLQCACRETTWSVEAGYDYEWRNDNYSANKATVRLTKRF